MVVIGAQQEELTRFGPRMPGGRWPARCLTSTRSTGFETLARGPAPRRERVTTAHEHDHEHEHEHEHELADDHGHSHVSSTDRSCVRGRVSRSSPEPLDSRLSGWGSGCNLPSLQSVALLADVVHNFGDALTAVPLGVAFFLRSLAPRSGPDSRWYSRSSSARESRYTRRSSDSSTPRSSLICGCSPWPASGFVGNEIAAQGPTSHGRRSRAPRRSQTATTRGLTASCPSMSS